MNHICVFFVRCVKVFCVLLGCSFWSIRQGKVLDKITINI